MPWRLVLIRGEAVPHEIAVDATLELGRDPGCDVRLMDVDCSRVHAVIEREGDGIAVVDRSRNGTFVDGARVERATVADGAIVALGTVAFAVVDSRRAGAATRVVDDAGGALVETQARDARAWTRGDAPDLLERAHAVCRELGSAEPARRAAILAAAATTLVGAHGAAVVRRGATLGGRMAARLARRLAGGDRARLLLLGRDLVGRTIAAEAVGSALSAPLAGDAHLVAVRALDAEPFAERELAAFACLAAEAAAFLALRGTEDDLGMAGTSQAMRDLRARIRRVAPSDAAVLITGETGVGKELVAQALHALSGRADAPLIAVNCAAISGTLFEAELFGHERGAFTGADQARPGRIRAAHGGTLFLDEVGELPMESQAKLLRVLQDGQVTPVGGERAVPADVRLVCATNRDLGREVEAGRFRADLYYRIDVIRLRVPPLGERRDDLPELATRLIARAAEEQGRPAPALDAAALAALGAQDWPGNVRQLDNALRRALVMAETTIGRDHLDLAPARPTAAGGFPTLAEIEAEHVRAALTRTGWNKSEAARLLGISRPTILKKIADYGLTRL
ncbi:MAG TPA: sigma 54-interacting transcriptional regulator [Planctomycetota bacterium]|nr:sigma 54-interacting transcriptional regulator [Planctomycetota bacterium]